MLSELSAVEQARKLVEGDEVLLVFSAMGTPSNAAGAAQCLVEVLRRAGDTLTRANVMREAANLKGYAPDTLLPGITIITGPDDFHPIEQLRMMRFEGDHWHLFGSVIDAELRN